MPRSAAGGQQPQHQLVLLQVGAGRVAPRVAAAAAGLEAELGQDAAVHVLGQSLGRLDRQPVGEVGLAVLAGGLQRVDVLGRLGAGGHDLEGDHVGRASPAGAQVVGDAQAVVPVLPRELEPAALAPIGVEHDGIVAVGDRLEEAVGGARHDPAPLERLGLHPRAARAEVVGEQPLPLLAAHALAAPRELVERPLVHQRERRGRVDRVHEPRAQERRLGHGDARAQRLAAGPLRRRLRPQAPAWACRARPRPARAAPRSAPPRSSPSLSRSITPRPSNASLQ